MSGDKIKPYGKPRPALVVSLADYVMSRAAHGKVPIAAVSPCAARATNLPSQRHARLLAQEPPPFPRRHGAAIRARSGRKRGPLPDPKARFCRRVRIKRDRVPGSASLGGAAGRLWVESAGFRRTPQVAQLPRLPC